MLMEKARIRVEELARRTETSVDTIRFYQKRGLLPPPEREGRIAWYRPEHVERLTRIRALQSQGFSLAVIRRLVTGDLDAADEPLAAAVAAASEHGDGTDETLTLDELAERSGVPAPLIEAVAREGLLVPHRRDGTVTYGVADIAIVRAGLQLLEQGLPLPELLALAREHHTATRAVAERAVELFDEHVRARLRDSDLPDAERATRLVDAFRALLPAVSDLVGHHFRRVLLETAQEHLESVGDPVELSVARAESSWRA